MTTRPDPADGSLVEREGVNAGSDRSTAEGAASVPSAESALSGGSTTGLPADRPEQPASEASGVGDPDAAYDSESGQDTGSIG
ncbi:MAG TPA: hypothetical protein VE781_11325 [Kineosporiaceae bacterium]|jgi:hypothetical protein|nr:hypothetical protein [Kineosporiaceae bacterium]